MCKEKGKEHEREVEEKFDVFVKQTIFDEGNKLRKEKGWPPITQEELDGMEGIDAPEDGGNA